ncbi:MAG: type I restriction enzyme HsdR N-terminal domain-containing protein [Bacteroidales bacterium]|nr:type I restriction enzyme HsdR N-terminal domain-containing protein [Bacteroidales bacterium]
MKQNIFSDFDFDILNNPEFEESSVREEIITPILKSLNYKAFGRNRIIREKAVTHPFVQTGSKKRELTNFPDYLLEVNGKYSWVLDAKEPNEDIKTGKNKEQAYFYAIHPEIRVNFYGLCNGREFILFHISKDEPLLYFQIKEIDNYWSDINNYLAPDAFVQKDILNEKEERYERKEFDYDSIKIPSEIVVKKQAAKRHFGVHGYFTKQAWNVVQHYIQNFSKRGDVILDPFGGGGSTLIEALMIHRKAIHIDLNPLSVFITKSLVTPIDFTELNNEFEKVKKQFLKDVPQTEDEIKKALEKYSYPKNISLAKDADVGSIEELFTDKQLAQLAFLKYLILKIKNDNIRNSLLLSFSSAITKTNRTYHPSKSRGDNAGDCAAFRYYRYRVALEGVELDLMYSFETKYKKMVAAKREMSVAINKETVKNAQFYKSDATNLDKIETESIDYVYTDPPYGSKIAYLDLSTMWNAWLDFEITEDDYKKEAIEGGSLNKSSEEYGELLTKSIKELYRVLKFDRWMSFVFAHKDPKYWHLIVDEAEKAGFEFAGAVKQSNGQTSFKKRQNPFSVLSGQLIINFKKLKSPQAIQKTKLGAEIYEIIIETIESVIAENDGANLEQINDRLIMTGLELGFLDILSKEYKDLSPILIDNFDYHKDTDTFHIIENKNFKTNIPLDLRIRYFLLSYLRRKENKKEYPTTDEIILDIMPLLKNGITPENQTILKVLEKIANHIGDNRWKIKKGGQLTLFE